MIYNLKSLTSADINPNKDKFLGVTSLQIPSSDKEYPSIHIVTSYMLKKGDKEREEGDFYHIFEHKWGTTAINYGPLQYKLVESKIHLSSKWTIFYKDKSCDYLIPISKELRYTREELHIYKNLEK